MLNKKMMLDCSTQVLPVVVMLLVGSLRMSFQLGFRVQGPEPQ